MNGIITNPDAHVHRRQTVEVHENPVNPLKEIQIGSSFRTEAGIRGALGVSRIAVKVSGSGVYSPDEVEAFAAALVKIAARQREIDEAR